MKPEEVSRELGRLEADRSEVETLIKRYDLQRRTLGLLGVEEDIVRWLRQRSADLSTQIEEMHRHTDMEDPPTSPAAYRRWVNRNFLET